MYALTKGTLTNLGIRSILSVHGYLSIVNSLDRQILIQIEPLIKMYLIYSFHFRYQSLHTAIVHSNFYTPILVNDHAPGEPNRRFDYIKGMVVPVKCIKFTYTGVKEHLTFLCWLFRGVFG